MGKKGRLSTRCAKYLPKEEKGGEREIKRKEEVDRIVHQIVV